MTKNINWAIMLISLLVIVFLLPGPEVSSSNFHDSETSANNILRISVDARVPISRTLHPSGAGVQTNCTRFPNTGEANWENVDETTSDEESTYNYATSQSSTIDLYTLSQISSFSSYSSGTLVWVQAWMRARAETNPTAANAINHIRIGGVQYDATAVSTTTSYANYSNTWSTNPQTSSSWTWADISALQAGMSIKQCKNGFKYTRVTQIWAVIRFMAPCYSYNDAGRTVLASNFSGSFKTIYLKGTNFSTGDYIIAYYDSGTSGGQKVASQTVTVGGDNQILGSYYFPTLPSALDGTWHALVQPAAGYPAFPASYNTVSGSPDTYGLVANNSFIVDASVLN